MVTLNKRIKTPTVLQMEAVECGAAALGIILGYYGKYVPLEELRVTCGISRDGSKASNIVKAATYYGLTAKGFKHETEELKSLKFPFIVFWNFNHFLVVEGFKKDIVYLNDPGYGPRSVTYDEFDKSFTGVVLTFSPGESFKQGGKRENVFARLKKRFIGSERNLVYIMIASLALTIPGLATPIFSKIFVDDYLVRHISSWITPLLIGMAITAILRATLTWLQQDQLLKLQSKLTLTTTSHFFWHTLRLPLTFYQQRFAGDISQRVDSNANVAQLVTGDLAVNIVNIISITFYALLMFWYSIELTLIGIFFAGLNFISLQYIAQKRKDENLKLLQDYGKMMGVALSGISMIETIKATGSEQDYFIRWSGYKAKVINSQQRLEVYSRLLAVVPPLLSGLMMVIILGAGGYRVMHGSMTVGMLVAFQSLMMSFSAPLANLVSLGANLQTIEGDLTRLDDVLHAELDSAVKTIQIPKVEQNDNSKLEGFLELKNITFGYSPLEPPLIENFNLSLTPGSRIAIIGSSGSGKTTVARLITGINKPWSGEILFDGNKREDIPRETLVNSLSAVDQDIFLFQGTVRDNLTLWDETRSEREIIEAAKDAYIHDIIMSRSKGYDSDVGEQGLNFSGGERQRLEIARALTMNPSILLMDEATASLDPLIEKAIDDHIRRRGCTTIMVAHRLSTIRDCDEIIVMQNGKIKERGTHDELLINNGLYSELIHLESSS